MKNSVFVFFITILSLSFLMAKTVNAQVFSLDPQIAQVTVGEKFTVDINIDTQGAEVTGADVKLTFDPNVLEVTNVQEGDFFTDEANNIGSGTLLVGGFFREQFVTKAGRGRVARLTLKGKKIGNSTLSFVCSIQSNDCNILNAAADDIIKCVEMKNGLYTFTSSTNKSTTTVTPTVPRPTINMPNTAFSIPTFFFAGIGSLLTILGLGTIFK